MQAGDNDSSVPSQRMPCVHSAIARRYSADSCGRLRDRRFRKSSKRTATGQRSFALPSTGRRTERSQRLCAYIMDSSLVGFQHTLKTQHVTVRFHRLALMWNYSDCDGARNISL